MALRRVKSKSFKLKREASDWAKKEKKSSGGKLKWETNRTENPDRPWEAVMYREVQ